MIKKHKEKLHLFIFIFGFFLSMFITIIGGMRLLYVFINWYLNR
jgi:hypothetical protein